MKQQTRRHVFETNSSSVHSLVIDKSGLEPSVLPIDKNKYILTDFGNFGKNYSIYNTQEDKLSYLVTLLYYATQCCIDEIEETYEFKMIEKYICQYTGASGVKVIGNEDPYIDHQSVPDYGNIGIVDIWDKDQVLGFIFNKYVSLQTDCD